MSGPAPRPKRALVDNAADPAQVADAERLARDRARQRAEDLAAVLATPHGRRVVWGELERCGVYRGAVGDTPHDTYYRLGRRAVGLELLAELTTEHAPAYLTMQQEALNG